jgi:hypothetical protein
MLKALVVVQLTAVCVACADLRGRAGKVEATPAGSRQLAVSPPQVHCLSRPQCGVVHAGEHRHQAIASITVTAADVAERCQDFADLPRASHRAAIDVLGNLGRLPIHGIKAARSGAPLARRQLRAQPWEASPPHAGPHW